MPTVTATTWCVVPLGCEKISGGNTSDPVLGKWLRVLMPLNTWPISVDIWKFLGGLKNKKPSKKKEWWDDLQRCVKDYLFLPCSLLCTCSTTFNTNAASQFAHAHLVKWPKNSKCRSFKILVANAVLLHQTWHMQWKQDKQHKVRHSRIHWRRIFNVLS